MDQTAIGILNEALTEEKCDELTFDDLTLNEFTEEIKDKLENVKELLVLRLNGCGLGSLKNFPELDKLVRLELINNNFSGSELGCLAHLKEMQSLSLGTNKIDSLAQLEPLKELKNLIQLDLSNSPVEETEDYRAKIFEMFPSLLILDNLDKNGNSIDYSDDEDEVYSEEEGVDEEDEIDYIDEFDDDEIDLEHGEDDIGGGKKLKA